MAKRPQEMQMRKEEKPMDLQAQVMSAGVPEGAGRSQSWEEGCD